MILQDLFNNISFLYNEYLTISNDTSVYDDYECYRFYCGEYNTEQELLDKMLATCPHFLTHEVISITSTQKYIDEENYYFCCLEIVVAM